MKITHYSSKYSFELLPSVMLQQCGGKLIVYISWLTESLEISFS